MQNEVTTLPTVYMKSLFQRKQNLHTRILPMGSKIHSTCKRPAFQFPNRKQLHPLHENPYGNSTRSYLQSDPLKQSNKSAITQKIVSEKMLRLKELQNQLSDAHFHLNELTNENKLLKTLQKRQDSALRQYEGTSADLPRIINSHHEELRIMESKYRKLRMQHNNTCKILKEREKDLYSVQMQNKHLLQLSKNRHSGEREKLQLQVADLNYRIGQQDETIKILNRKLVLETKHLKHQLQMESTKHKETQKQLQEALDKLKNAEDLLGNKGKRLLCNSSQLNIINKGQNSESQAFNSLNNNSVTFNCQKDNNQHQATQVEDHHKIMLKDPSEKNKDESILNLENNQSENLYKSETMERLSHVRNFRLQKPSCNRIISFGNKISDLSEIEQLEDIKDYASNAEKLANIKEDIQLYNRPTIKPRNDEQTARNEGKSFFKKLENTGEDCTSAETTMLGTDTIVLARKSRELHTRLTSNGNNNYDIEKLSLNLAGNTNSLEIEDIDTLISEQLRLNEFTNTLGSVETIVKELKYAPIPTEISTALDSDFKLHSFKEQEISKHAYSFKSIDDINKNESKTELQKISSNNPVNTGIISSQEQKLSIKHSISQESEPEKLEEMREEADLKNEALNTLQNDKQFKDSFKDFSVVDMKSDYNKENLLATLKIIDNNENIEFLDLESHKYRKLV